MDASAGPFRAPGIVDTDTYTMAPWLPFDDPWLSVASSWFVDDLTCDSGVNSPLCPPVDSINADPDRDPVLNDGRSISSVSPESAKNLSADALGRQRRRAYAQRKKSELEELRAAVVELRGKRDALVAKTDELGGPIVRSSGQRGLYVGGWRGIALRQLQRRIGAQVLNWELRKQLRRFNGVVQQLAREFEAHAALTDATRLSTVLRTQEEKQALRFTDSDMRTILSLANGLGDMFSQTDAVLCHVRASDLPEHQRFSVDRAWRRDPETGSSFLEQAERGVLPFDVATSIRAQEKVLSAMVAEECEPATMDLPGGVSAVKFTYSFADGEAGSTPFQCILVGSMAVEDSRAITCWRSVSQESGRVGLASDRIEEMGWGVASRNDSTPGCGEARSGTTFSFCTRYSLSASACGSTIDPALKRFGELLARSEQDETAAWYESMEEAVMDEVAAGQVVDVRL